MDDSLANTRTLSGGLPLMATGVSDTAIALRVFGRATKALTSVRAALEAAEAGLPTPREHASCPLVKLPRLDSTATVSSAAPGAPDLYGSPSASPRTAALVGQGRLSISKPRASRFRVAVDTSDEDSEDGLDGRLLLMPAAVDGGAHQTPGIRASASALRPGAPEDIVMPPAAAAHGGGEPTAGHQPRAVSSLRLYRSTYSTGGSLGGSAMNSPAPQSWSPPMALNRRHRRAGSPGRGGLPGDSSAPSSPTSALLSAPVSPQEALMDSRGPGGVISAAAADRIVRDLRAAASGSVLHDTQQRLLARRERQREELAARESRERSERMAAADEPTAFRRRVEDDCAAHERAVELGRRAIAARRAAANHAELVYSNRIAALTEIARQRADAEAEDRRRVAALGAASRLRVVLGQLEGAETAGRCRVAADQVKGFVHIGSLWRRVNRS